jgi:hypothetical protein
MKRNTITGEVSERVPDGVYEGIQWHGGVPDDVAARAGWVDMPAAEVEAMAATQAAAAEMQRRGAALFFKTQTPAPALGAALRQLFPEYPDAEVNRAVTSGAVGARVDALANQKRAEGDQMGYADMIALGVRLSTWFNALSAANGTDETWTLFEKYPEIMQ